MESQGERPRPRPAGKVGRPGSRTREYLSDTDRCCPGCAVTWHRATKSAPVLTMKQTQRGRMTVGALDYADDSAGSAHEPTRWRGSACLRLRGHHTELLAC